MRASRFPARGYVRVALTPIVIAARAEPALAGYAPAVMRLLVRRTRGASRAFVAIGNVMSSPIGTATMTNLSGHR
jgi:hypothetical protein